VAATIEGTVLVSGGTGALGRAVLSELLETGADVVATWVHERELDAVREEVGEHERLSLFEADLFSDEGAAAAVEAAAQRGPLAGLAHLVGGFAAGGRLHEAPAGEFDKMMALNLGTAERLIRVALPRLLDSQGAVVCVGAKHALNPFPGAAGTIVSKAALLALVRTLAVEYAADGVRFNAVLPSMIDTPANREGQPDPDTSKWVPPSEIAAVIAFLLSGDSAPVSGAQVPVYGADA